MTVSTPGDIAMRPANVAIATRPDAMELAQMGDEEGGKNLVLVLDQVRNFA